MIWYPVSGPAPNQCSTSYKIILTLCLNAFRGEPASSWFDWHFTPNHNSSTDFSTSVGSDLHVVSPTLHPGHGQITKVRVYLMLLNALFRLDFSVAPDINSLTLQHKITRRLILQQERSHPRKRAPAVCKLTVSGSISLSFSLFFSPFHHCTRSLSVIRSIQPYQMGLADSDRISRAPSYSGYFLEIIIFRLQDCNFLWCIFPNASTI